MKKRLLSLGAIILTLCLVLTSLLPLVAVAAPSTGYSKVSNSGIRDELCTSLDGTSAGSYYTGSYTYEKLSSLSGAALRTSLGDLMTDTHAKNSSYDDCHYMANNTDCEDNDTTHLTTIYSSYSATQDEWGEWNREHVWPKSLGGFGESKAGADLHHIRPSEMVINSFRNNNKYGNVSGGTTKAGNLSGDIGGYYKDGYFEPLDNVKGDVARIILYVHVRYYNSHDECKDVTNVFESVDVLLAWCEMDPVDTWEMGRNEVVQAYQGNRNVFIDYPELAWSLFGEDAPEGMSTPSGSLLAGGDNGGNQGGTEEPDEPVIPDVPGVCTHKNTVAVDGFEATCRVEGYEGDIFCVDCGEMVEFGEVLLRTEDHTWNDGAITVMPTQTAEGVRLYICTTCGITHTTAVPMLSEAVVQSAAMAEERFKTYAAVNPEFLNKISELCD